MRWHSYNRHKSFTFLYRLASVKKGSAILSAFAFFFLLPFCGDNHDRSVEGSGTIETDEISVSPIMPGRIKEIHVKEGDSVRKGEILVTMVEDEVRANLEVTRAGMDAARKGAAQAKATLDNVQKERDRARELFEAGAVSQRDLDKAETAAKMALSAYQAASAKVRQLEAGLVLAESRRDEAYLTSPIEGIVFEKNFHSGEVALPGSAILTIGDLSSVYLRIFVPAGDLSGISPGSRAKVKAEGMENWVEGTVLRISDTAEFTPKNVQTEDARARLVFAVKIGIKNPGNKMKPGMPADAILEKDEADRKN